MSKRVILRLVIDLTESDDEEPKKIWEKVVCEDDAESFAGNQLPAQVHLTENEAAALERIYVNEEDKTLMDYCVFVHEINLVFTRPVI